MDYWQIGLRVSAVNKKIQFYCQNFQLKLNRISFKASLGIVDASFVSLFDHKDSFLHPHELAYFENLKHQKKQHSYLLGRYAGKQTLQQHFPEQNLNDIFISRGVFHFPIINGLTEKMQISLTHSEQVSAALIFPEEHPMGIDLELIDDGQTAAIQSQLTDHEKSLFQNPSSTYVTHTAFLMWTAKEALAKILRTGLMTPFHIYEIQTIKPCKNGFISLFTNFSQYKALTFSNSKAIISIVLPQQSEYHIDIESINTWIK